MIEERYRSMMKSIQPGEDLLDQTLEAAENPSRKAPGKLSALRLAVGAVCAFVLIVTAALRLLPPPRDVVASTGETAAQSEAFLPLPSKIPSDDLSLSVSDVAISNENKLTFILTLSGDRVDSQTIIDYEEHTQEMPFRTTSVVRLDPVEGQSEHEQRIQFTIELQEGASLSNLGSVLNMAVTQYTSGDYVETLEPDFDWATFPFSLENSDCVLEISKNSVITAIGFSEDGHFTVRLRWDDMTPDQRYSVIWLTRSNPETGETEEHYFKLGRQYYEGPIWYYDYTFGLSREELEGWQLVIHTFFTGEIIRGTWPFMVDLTHLISE